MAKRKKEPEIRLPKIKQLPSGAWHTRVYLGGQRTSITRDTYEECLSEYLAVKNGILEAQERPRGQLTLGEAVDAYIEDTRDLVRRGRRSPSTVYGYIRYRDNTFQRAMAYNIYTTPDARWQAAIDDERKMGRSPKYIKNAWGLMSAAIKKETGKQPKVVLFEKEDNERPFLEPDQIDIFVEAVKGDPVEIPALLCLSSLRCSEMLALTWENIDFANRAIYVRGAKVRGEDGLKLKPQNKTKKSRRPVPMIPPLYDALTAAPKDTEFVVNAATCTLFNRINKICRENNLPEVGMHGLRHSFASLAYHMGIPEMMAADIGGWKDLGTMRKIYTHLAERDIAKRSKEFTDYFTPEAMKNRKIGNGLATKFCRSFSEPPHNRRVFFWIDQPNALHVFVHHF